MIMKKGKSNTYLIFVLIFLLSFLIRAIPLLQGYTVPHGYVDTSSHISLALDLKEGDIDSLVHPWWHVKNHYIINDYDIVDRNAASFFYPPFIALILAGGYMFLHPGIGTIIIISLLYSLSTIAVFLLCKSFGVRDRFSLIASLIIALSPALLVSQYFGFWSFMIALNFMILSYSYFRLGRMRLSVLFAFISAITHWGFIVLIIAVFLLEFNKGKKSMDYLKYSLAFLIPFYLVLIITWNPFTYVTTHFTEFLFVNIPLAILAVVSFVLFFKKYKPAAIASIIIIALVCVYYAFPVILFGDMLQFVIPFIIAFFIAVLLNEIPFFRKNSKLHSHSSIVEVILLLIIGISLMLNIIALASICHTTQPSITNKQFDALLGLRSGIDNDKSVLSIQKGMAPWIVLVGKDSLILYPFSYEDENMVVYYNNYIIGEEERMGLRLYEIDIEEGVIKEVLFENAPKFPR